MTVLGPDLEVISAPPLARPSHLMPGVHDFSDFQPRFVV